jgi:hypothetical protein
MDRWEMELPPNLTLFRRRFAPVFALLPSSHCSRLHSRLR